MITNKKKTEEGNMKMKGIITATVCGLLLALGGGTACLNSYAEDNRT